MRKFTISNRIGEKRILIYAAALCLILLCPLSSALGRALYDPVSQDNKHLSADWRNPYSTIAVHDLNKMGMTITNFGVMGSGFSEHISTIDPVTGTPTLSAAYPYPEPYRYLFSGALWIGAVVGRDTLVSVGADGWNLVYEMNAVEENGPITREYIDDVYGYVSSQIYTAIFTDTVTNPDFVQIDPVDNRPHIPLNMEITQTTLAGFKPESEIPPSDHDFVIFDYAVKNIGLHSLNDVYFGIFVDGVEIGPENFFQGDGLINPLQ